MSGQFTGPGALTKAGPGTLVLTNSTNNYNRRHDRRRRGHSHCRRRRRPPAGSPVNNNGAFTVLANSTSGTITAMAPLHRRTGHPRHLTSAAGSGTSTVAPLPSTALSTLNFSTATSLIITTPTSPNSPPWSPRLQHQRHPLSGTGITSSTAAAYPDQGLGILTGQQYLTLHPNTPSTHHYPPTDVIIKYLQGDATLDGKITIDDYLQLTRPFSCINPPWFNGDFNYDGTSTSRLCPDHFAFQHQLGLWPKP